MQGPGGSGERHGARSRLTPWVQQCSLCTLAAPCPRAVLCCVTRTKANWQVPPHMTHTPMAERRLHTQSPPKLTPSTEPPANQPAKQPTESQPPRNAKSRTLLPGSHQPSTATNAHSNTEDTGQECATSSVAPAPHDLTPGITRRPCRVHTDPARPPPTHACKPTQPQIPASEAPRARAGGGKVAPSPPVL